MNPFYAAYTLLTSGVFISGYPAFWVYTRLSGRYRTGLAERLGVVPRRLVRGLTGTPRIWIHAVSLGEVKVAEPILESLRRLLPSCSVLLSTTTEHGRELARQLFDEDIPVVYAPMDNIISVREALSRVRPNALVFVETEIWPAWLTEAHRMGIKTALVNGRISDRAIGGYLRFRPFFREVLRNVDSFSMILGQDAARIRAIGANPRRIEINGNAKYDLLAMRVDPEMGTKIRRILSLNPTHIVFIAGSTREGEEAMILDVFERIRGTFPEAILIIAPRHIDRTPRIEYLLKRRGLKYHLRTDLEGGTMRTEPVLIMNTFGELFELYSVGTIIFCGASLVPLGGQNPIEPAVWGKVVFYGPSMEDFLDAKAMVEGVGAGIQVSGPETFAEKAIWFLNHPDALVEYGARARQAVMDHQGAAEKHAKVIARLV